MKTIICALVLGLSVCAQAQTAVVVELTADEAKQAKDLHDQMEAMKTKQTEFEAKIQQKYILEPVRHHSSEFHSFTGTGIVKPGWNGGEFEYSADFRFIVPAHINNLQIGSNPSCAAYSTEHPLLNMWAAQ